MSLAFIWLYAIAVFALLAFAGAALLFACGFQEAKHYAWTPVVGLAFASAASLLSPVFTWQASALLIELAASLCAAALIRFASTRQSIPAMRGGYQLSQLRASFACIAKPKLAALMAGTLTSNILLFFVMFAGASDTSEVYRLYDNPFHYSVIRHIAETGSASPIGAGSVLGAESSIYPCLWHAMAALAMQLFGTSIQQSVWIAIVLTLGLIAPLGIGVLAQSLFKQATPLGLFLATGTCLFLPFSIPYFLTFGSLFANMLGLALTPFAVATFAMIVNTTTTNSGELQKDQKHRALRPLLLLGCCVVAIGFAHPNSAFTLLLFFLALALHSKRSAFFKAAFTLGFGGCWLLLMQTPLFFRTVNCLDRITPSSEIGRSTLAALGLNYNAFNSSMGVLIMVGIILAAAAFAAMKLQKRWHHSWYLTCLGLLACILICSLFPETTAGKIASGFWYRDAERLRVAVVYLASAFICLAPNALAFCRDKASSANPGIAKAGYAAGMLLITLALFAVCINRAIHYYVPCIQEASSPSVLQEGTGVLSASQQEFLGEAASIIGNSAVLNCNQDGSVWLYALYGSNALQNGCAVNRMAPMSSELYTVVNEIALYAENSAEGAKVRTAVEALNLEYVVQSSAISVVATFNDQGSLSYAPAESTGRINADTPGFELVYQQGDMQLYKIERVAQ